MMVREFRHHAASCRPGLVDVDDAALRPFDVVVGRLQQLQDDVLDILADVAGFGPNRFRPPPEPVSPDHSNGGTYRAVAIGASTGGPAALVRILRSLPGDFPLPILIVNHIGEKFGSLLAEWLDSQSALRVSCAVDGEPLPEVGCGRVILAPPGRHVLLERGRLQLTDDAERHSCKPSVDILFESVAREIGDRSIACLLTGMGKDGAAGLLAVRQAGGRTLAQDEATSTIFGMPQEAIRIGAAEKIVGLPDFAPTLMALVDRKSTRLNSSHL